MNKVMFNSELTSVHNDSTPFTDSSLARSYMHFYGLANEKDNMFFASAEDYNEGKICGYWMPQGEKWIPVVEEVAVNFVFNKLDCFDDTHARVLNDLRERGVLIYGDCRLGEFVADKWKCYEEFADYFSLTERIHKKESAQEQIQKFFERMDSFYAEHNNAVILKPISGWQARGIHLVTRENGKLQLRHLFGQLIEEENLIAHIFELFTEVPYIIQAYVDTKGGIPEIGLGEVAFHDVRFVFYIKESGVAQFVQLYLKTPQGMVYYPVEQFPQEVFSVVEPVATKIATMFSFGVFSVDVMRDRGGNWYLTELNDQIGFNINWQKTSDVQNVTHLMMTFLEDMSRLQRSFSQ
ncbi:hypothetical protein [Candidatus Uabimicrobium sp. HlEnr_7]|uniref:hypothetical protein n=1 Tax=Candidatus Uabimicrobium helgolandensis TaxID=3095367 RepID=UPI0035562380